MINKKNNKIISLFIIISVYLIRIFSSMQDGISDRIFDCENHVDLWAHTIYIGWWSFHVVGWLARDIPSIILLYCNQKYIKNNFGGNKISIIFYWGLHAILNFILHYISYYFSSTNRHLFYW